MKVSKIKVLERMVRGEIRFVVDLRYVLPKGRRHFFGEASEAEKFLARVLPTIPRNNDDKPLILTGKEKRDVESARDILGPEVSFVEAALAFKKENGLAERKKISKALPIFQEQKAKASKDRRYLFYVLSRVKSLQSACGDKFVDEVTAADVHHWVHEQAWGDYTKSRALIDVQTFFNFCMREGFCRSNPVKKVERIESHEFEKGILTPGQARVFMETVAKVDGPMVRYFADQLFGFMREKEAHLLTRDQVFETYIDFPKTKTKRIRFVDFNPTWKAWREFGEHPTSNIQHPTSNETNVALYWPIKNWDRRIRKVRRLATAAMIEAGVAKKDFRFPRNCLRHSACTYGAKKFGASKAAEWAGHEERIQKRNYRRPVTEAEAEEFWGIFPK